MIFRFAQPEWLWLLAALPILAWLLGRAGRRAAILFSSIALARQVAALVRNRPGRFSRWLRWLAAACLIVALARPQLGSETSELTSSGVDILIAVDLSTSMWAHDMELGGVATDRLTIVKSVVREFIGRRGSDRIGMIAFAAEPYLVSPLTLNHDWLQRRLDDVQIGIIEDGTAIGSAIGAGTNRLMDRAAQSRVLILLTDGANNRGRISPQQAAEAAAAFGIRIYTIGVGMEGMVPYPRIDPRTAQPLRDRSGNLIFTRMPSDADMPSLKAVAERTGGRAWQAADTRTLREIYAEIDRLERTELRLKVNRLYADQFAWPLLAGALLLLLELVLMQTRYRQLPG
jgi:Ca-activated chloride channel homolog